jgi:hypothetical protein
MALTADRKVQRLLAERPRIAAGVATAAKIFTGALVNRAAAGYAKPASDTAGEIFLGISVNQQDNTLGANAALTAECDRFAFDAKAAGMNAADLGEPAYVVDDETVGRGIVAQPAAVTGVALTRLPSSRGGTRALAYTAAGTLLAFGGGTGVNVGAGGEFVLTATDGAQILATVTAGSLPVGDQSDNIQLRHVRAGSIVDVVSATQVFVDPNL